MMQRAIAAYKRSAALPQDGTIPALNGLRFLMVFLVAAFHFWQQTWLAPGISLGQQFISLDPLLRTGYLWVDGMLLLSAFLLFLPQARRMEAGRGFLPQKGFYRRRVARIVPTYLFNILVVFLLAVLVDQRYRTAWAAGRDLLAHLTFTHPLFGFSSLSTPLNGVLWTLGVEMQFYLLFPLIARFFARFPALSYCSLSGLAFLFRGIAMAQPDTRMLVNQLPAFLDVFMNGLVLSMVFARLEKRLMDDGVTRAFLTVVMVSALMGLAVLVRAQAAIPQHENIRISQMRIRYLQSVLTGLVFIGASLGVSGVRVLLGNRVTAFLGAISFQFYMWHQVVALRLKAWGVPKSAHQNPHMVGDISWQVGFLVLAFSLTFVISVLITYLIEKPLTRLFSGRGTGGRK